MESDTIAALVEFIEKFSPSKTDFVDDPMMLLDGFVLFEIFNRFADKPFDVSRLKPGTNPDNRTNLMLNMNSLVKSMSEMLMEHGISVNVSVHTLVRDKDQTELLKILKMLLFCCIKSQNKKIAIKTLRQLDKHHLSCVETLLEEIAVNRDRNSDTSESKSNEDLSKEHNNDKLNELDKEILRLQARKAELQQQIDAATEEAVASNPEVDRLSHDLEEHRRRLDEAREKKENQKKKVASYEEQLHAVREEVMKLEEEKSTLSHRQLTNEDIYKQTADLKSKLAELQGEIVSRIKSNTGNSVDVSKLTSVKDYINLLSMDELRSSVANKQKELEAIRIDYDRKSAELRSLERARDEKEQIAKDTLRRRISMLSAELESGEIGEVRRTSLRLKDKIATLQQEIEDIRLNSPEIHKKHELSERLKKLAERKNAEISLLMDKQSYVQDLEKQSSKRLARLKYNIALKMHQNRIDRWSNAFVCPDHS